MTYRIFVTGSGITPDAQKFLESENCVLMQGDPRDSSTDIAQKVANFSADALIVRQGRIDEAVIVASENLRVICKHGTGTDNIDTDAASRHGIPVMYTPDANYESVAEHTLGLILSLYRKIAVQDRKIRDGIFDKKNYGGQELLGKTLGLVGFGRVARRIGELVAPFKVTVVAYHPSNEQESLPPHISKASSLTDVLRQSDIVSLHVPLTTETRGMINAEAIAKMKNEAILINTARGPIVVEHDLIQALREGQIAGAALDTFETEPPATDSPLYAMDNVVMTMHTAGNSDASLMNMAMGSARNVLTVLKNMPLDARLVLNQEAVCDDLELL